MPTDRSDTLRLVVSLIGTSVRVAASRRRTSARGARWTRHFPTMLTSRLDASAARLVRPRGAGRSPRAPLPPPPREASSAASRPSPPPPRARARGFGAGVADAQTDAPNPLDDHVPIDRLYDGLRQLHASPDVFLVDDFLTPEECDDIVAAASSRDMSQSPVVYAGWTNDVGDIITTAARGPALWAAAASMLSAASADGPGRALASAGLRRRRRRRRRGGWRVGEIPRGAAA